MSELEGLIVKNPEERRNKNNFWGVPWLKREYWQPTNVDRPRSYGFVSSESLWLKPVNHM